MAQRTSQGVMDGGSALPSGTAQPALPLAEALGRRNPDQRAPSPALAKKEALYATRPKPPAQLIRATRSFRGSMAGLYAPLPTLRRRPRGRLRTDRGRRGLLLLHRSGLSPHTPCQSPGALTHVTARWIARPPKAAFVTRLQPARLPDQAARQLPDQSTTLRVASSSTGDTRLRGALKNKEKKQAAGSR